MHTPLALLKFTARAVLNALGGGLAGDFVVDVLPAVAQDVWATWGKDRSPARRKADIEALAQATPADLREAVREAVAEVAGDQPEAVRQVLTVYLTQLPP